MKFAKTCLYAACVLLMTACGTSRSVPQELKEGEDSVNAVKKIKMNEKEQKAYSNIYDFLRSRVPGLMIRGTEISIRGINSVNSASKPLILVDGVEMNDISALNPYEVDNVEILKDSAASIYGFRGAGGVIKITTVSGRK